MGAAGSAVEWFPLALFRTSLDPDTGVDDDEDDEDGGRGISGGSALLFAKTTAPPTPIANVAMPPTMFSSLDLLMDTYNTYRAFLFCTLLLYVVPVQLETTIVWQLPLPWPLLLLFSSVMGPT